MHVEVIFKYLPLSHLVSIMLVIDGIGPTTMKNKKGKILTSNITIATATFLDL